MMANDRVLYFMTKLPLAIDSDARLALSSGP
jgi:hypothetical protein